jgi:hypothetical protein
MLKINLLYILLKFHYKALIISALHECLGYYTGNHLNKNEYRIFNLKSNKSAVIASLTHNDGVI